MEVLLGFFGTKTVAALIGVMALLGAKNKDVAFTKPEISIVADTIYISTSLKNSFPKGLKDIILSGTPVNMRFTLQGVTRGKGSNLYREIIHNVKYDIVTKKFLVTLSEENTTISVEKFEAAEILMNKLKEIKIIRSNRELNMLLKATIDPVNIEAIGGKEFQLMAFWDYQTPYLKFPIKK